MTKAIPNPLAGDLKLIYSYCVSQPCRTMHDFLWLGFNEDSGGRRVFDGMLNWIGGGSGIFMKYRFAQPARTTGSTSPGYLHILRKTRRSWDLGSLQSVWESWHFSYTQGDLFNTWVTYATGQAASVPKVLQLVDNDRSKSGAKACGWRIAISPKIPQDSPSWYHSSMRNLAVLFIHLIATLARLLGPGGVRSVVAESLLLKHQLLIVNRSRQRSPNLSAWDRIFTGWMALLVRPTRLLRSAIVLKPSTLLALHNAMSKRKYRMLFSQNRRRKPGPKGPSAELIRAVVEMKQRNPNWGCPRIAQQLALAFHIPIDKDVVRRILAHQYRPAQPSGGPSWLTFLGHMKDSLWSMDLFRCESATLRTYWVLVVMDQYTRRIIGFGVHAGTVDGVALCRMFNRALRGHRWMPKYLSSDNDPLYRFHQWQANLSFRASGPRKYMKATLAE
jgi:putative transposase